MEEQRTLLASFDKVGNQVGDKKSLSWSIIQSFDQFQIFEKEQKFFPYQV